MQYLAQFDGGGDVDIGTGSISARRCSSHAWVCSVWHFGQLRKRLYPRDIDLHPSTPNATQRATNI
jgi:hypothetical protein